jgi:hypothetical protein
LQRTQMVSSHSSVPSTPVTDPPMESSSLSPETSRVSSTGVFRMLTQQISQLRDAIQVFFWSMSSSLVIYLYEGSSRAK